MYYLPLFLPQSSVAVSCRTELGEIKKRSPLQCLGLRSCGTKNKFSPLWKYPATLETRRQTLYNSQVFGSVAKPEAWWIHFSRQKWQNLYSDFWWKKMSPRTDFSGCIFSSKLETLSSSKSMDIIDEREEYTDWRLGNFREAGLWLRLLCIWFAVMPLIGVFHPSLTLEIPPWGTLAFILLVTFSCFLSPSLPCLILPHLSRISKIHLFSATSWANCGWHWILHSLLCFCLHKWFSKVFWTFLTHPTDEHYIVPVPSQSSTLSSTSTGIYRCQTHWKVKTSVLGGWIVGIWDISLRRHPHAKSRINIYYFFKKYRSTHSVLRRRKHYSNKYFFPSEEGQGHSTECSSFKFCSSDMKDKYPFMKQWWPFPHHWDTGWTRSQGKWWRIRTLVSEEGEWKGSQ